MNENVKLLENTNDVHKSTGPSSFFLGELVLETLCGLQEEEDQWETTEEQVTCLGCLESIKNKRKPKWWN